MKFQQLEAIAKKYITGSFVEFPVNAFELAKQLSLRVKNSIECKNDFKDKYPLYNCNAVYTLVYGEYTIYYDEKYAYKNFSVAHEIAHHLLEHCSDGVREHHDANLLAAILILPPESILKNKIKNATELSEKYLIPYSVACEYWIEIKGNIKKDSKIFTIKIITVVLIVMFVLTIIFIYFTYAFHKKSDIEQEESTYSHTEETQSPKKNVSGNFSIPDSNKQLYYATSSGDHYHKKDCHYIKYKNNIREVSADEISKLNLTPCSACIE